MPAQPVNGFAADPYIAHQYRQQHQVGQHDDRDAYAGSNTQILDDLDGDQHHGGEADSIGDQSCHTRYIECAERSSSRSQALFTVNTFSEERIDDLHAMTDAYGENQEGYQYGISVKAVAQGCKQTELPDHRDDRAQQGCQGTSQASSVEKQQYRGDDQRDNCEPEYRSDSVQQISDNLGKTDNVNFYGGLTVLGSRKFFVLFPNIFFQ